MNKLRYCIAKGMHVTRSEKKKRTKCSLGYICLDPINTVLSGVNFVFLSCIFTTHSSSAFFPPLLLPTFLHLTITFYKIAAFPCFSPLLWFPFNWFYDMKHSQSYTWGKAKNKLSFFPSMKTLLCFLSHPVSTAFNPHSQHSLVLLTLTDASSLCRCLVSVVFWHVLTPQTETFVNFDRLIMEPFYFEIPPFSNFLFPM